MKRMSLETIAEIKRYFLLGCVFTRTNFLGYPLYKYFYKCLTVVKFKLLACFILSCVISGIKTNAQELSTEIVVVGATPAGIMAAVAAARLGSEVTILEPTDHVGGIMSNGLTKCDITNKKAIGGLFVEFT